VSVPRCFRMATLVVRGVFFSFFLFSMVRTANRDVRKKSGLRETQVIEIRKERMITKKTRSRRKE